MKFTFMPALLATITLASLAVADRVITRYGCDVSQHGLRICGQYQGTWYDNGSGEYQLGLVGDGCHGGNGVPHLREFCLDYANKQGHFFFNGQNKRCLNIVQDGQRVTRGERGCWAMECWITDWHETPCGNRRELNVASNKTNIAIDADGASAHTEDERK